MKSKVLLLFLIIICILINFSTVAYAEEYTNYLALGDSITAGYGLNNVSDGYSYKLKDALQIKNDNFKNLAVSGMTAKRFNEIIRTEEYTEVIKNADLITISIGANEILQTVRNNFSEISGITIEQTRDLELFNKLMTEKISGNGVDGLKDLYAMVTKVYERLNSDEMTTFLMEKIEQYKTEWEKGIDYIKDINPNATIIVTEFYNPYYNFVLLYDWGEISDRYIKEFNKYLYEISEDENNYKIAKIYDDFNVDEPRITNISTNLSAFSIDPHPNINGHEIIAESILEVLDYKNELKKNENQETNQIQKYDEKRNYNIVPIIIVSVIEAIVVLSIIVIVRKK